MTLPPQGYPDFAAAVARYRPLEDLIPSGWTQDTLVTNGFRHHVYRTGGGKPPVLLLHGFLDGAPSWFRTATALAAEFDVIMPDARGHGRSDRSGARYDPDQMAEDGADIIRALECAPARVLGHSMGGGTAIRLADRHPDLVRAVIIEGWGDTSAGAADLSRTPQYQAWLNEYVAWLERLKTLDHADRMASALSQLQPGSPLLPEEEYVAWVDTCAHLDLDLVRLVATLWSRLTADVEVTTQALRRAACPVLVMKSDFFPTPGERRLRDEPSDRPNVRVVRFEHTGHLIHRDAFQPFVELTRDFLRAP